MSCITRVPLAGHRHLGLIAVQARPRGAPGPGRRVADLVPNWTPRGNERERLKWCRQERVRTARAIKAVRRAIAAAGATP